MRLVGLALSGLFFGCAPPRGLQRIGADESRLGGGRGDGEPVRRAVAPAAGQRRRGGKRRGRRERPCPRRAARARRRAKAERAPRHESRAMLVKEPIDIIVVLDNSGSMDEELDSVERNINVNFARNPRRRAWSITA